MIGHSPDTSWVGTSWCLIGGVAVEGGGLEDPQWVPGLGLAGGVMWIGGMWSRISWVGTHQSLANVVPAKGRDMGCVNLVGTTPMPSWQDLLISVRCILFAGMSWVSELVKSIADLCTMTLLPSTLQGDGGILTMVLTLLLSALST